MHPGIEKEIVDAKMRRRPHLFMPQARLVQKNVPQARFFD